MIAATPRGLLVTRFWYIRPVDPRTALYTGVTRDGLWYIEDGTIRYPVHELPLQPERPRPSRSRERRADRHIGAHQQLQFAGAERLADARAQGPPVQLHLFVRGRVNPGARNKLQVRPDAREALPIKAAPFGRRPAIPTLVLFLR